MEFEFSQPRALIWIVLIAAIGAIVAIRQLGRIKAFRRFADAPLLSRIAPGFSSIRPFVRACLVMAAMAATVLALMDPRWGLQLEEVRRSGLDCYFVVDVSRSMLAGDATPSRLERAKEFVADASEHMLGDRVGLIEFAGVPAIRVPLTLNYGAFREAINDLSPQSTTRGGTEMAGAIDLAIRSFSEESNSGKAIVILSDGEDMGDSPIAQAEEALKKGIHVYTIGIGDARDGARIPVMRGGTRTWLVFEGQEVWSKMNPELMKQVAEAGGGAFIPAGTSQLDMGPIYDQTVGQLDRSQEERAVIQRRMPRYQWFAGLALVLLVGESVVSDRRSRRPAAVGSLA